MLGEQQGAAAMNASMPAQPRTTSAGCMPATRGYHRSGFTLVELLVVLLIVGMLAAILTPVVMQSLAKARTAAIKAEIDMLHMAIMNYKNEYWSFPPCFDTTFSAVSPAGKHLQRLFPRCTTVPAQLAGPAAPLQPLDAIAWWLLGYTQNPVSPLLPPTDRQKLYDFDQSRLAGLVYHPSQKPESPYIYIDSTNYGTAWPAAPVTYTVGSQTFTIPANAYTAQIDPSTGTFFNPDTFQILCAGRDGAFEVAGSNDDDVSNFWPGTRGEYLDSLNN